MSQDNDKSDRDEQLRKLEMALEKARADLAEQSERLDALGSGREETMRLLSEARADLARVATERDQLQKRLVAIEGMQTETVAFPDDQDTGLTTPAVLPSIDELMSTLDSMLEDGGESGGRTQLRGQAAEPPEAEWQEMISPEEIAPEEFGDEKKADAEAPRTARLLVFMDSAHPIKYPLSKEVTTIGRSDSADIRVHNEFVSRIHARIVRREDRTAIEDADSKNGFKVNSNAVKHHDLKHGDVIGIGALRFMFVDTAQQR